jgi:hypothetical protein
MTIASPLVRSLANEAGARACKQSHQRQSKETTMAHVLTFAGGVAAGYALAIYTWPAARDVFAGAEAEIAWLKSRLAALGDKARDVFGWRG